MSDVTAQQLRTYAPSDSLSVGDIFHYSLKLQLDGEYDRITFPDTSAFPPSIEVVVRQQFKLSQFADSLDYRLQFFASEDVQIPPLPVILHSGGDSTVVYSDPVVLHFKSVVDEGDTSVKPLKPIFDFPRAWWPWLLAAALLAGFLIWWFKFRDEPEPDHSKSLPQFEPFHDPLKELENTLFTIRKERNVAQTKAFKTFYSEISDAIRTYFEDLYKIPALESTTREMLRYLDAYGTDREMVEYTRRILRNADLVKFAKFTPTLEDAQATYQLAIDFLDRAKLADASRISHLRERYEAQFERPQPQNEGA